MFSAFLKVFQQSKDNNLGILKKQQTSLSVHFFYFSLAYSMHFGVTSQHRNGFWETKIKLVNRIMILWGTLKYLDKLVECNRCVLDETFFLNCVSDLKSKSYGIFSSLQIWPPAFLQLLELQGWIVLVLLSKKSIAVLLRCFIIPISIVLIL